MKIEDIIKYLTTHYEEYSFEIREYADSFGYYNEAVVFAPLVSDSVGIIIEENPFNPALEYTKNEMFYTLNRLEEKAIRIKAILKKASEDFNTALCLTK